MPLQQQSSRQTVLHLAEHLARLKAAATELHQSTAARERGYFSPTEDDQVLHLWVSYHMARNALFDLITKYRQTVESGEQASLADFTITYAAAVILVDGGRFLRELFADNPMIRRKLNESHELYGIPTGSFDSIQLSLSDPSQVMQLYWANHVFDENIDGIQADESLADVLQIIGNLGHRMRVSPSAYAKARANERARALYDRILRGGLLQSIYTIQSLISRWIGQVRTQPGHRPALPDTIKTELLTLLEPGDVLVTRKEHSLTNYFLPGYWPHVALYIGEGRVIEALADGVHERSVESPFSVDALAVIRPLLAPQQINQALERARTHVGKPYDFDFDFTRADRMVCTEVVYRSYQGIGEMEFPLTRRAARQNLSAEDLLNLARQERFFRNVAVYCPGCHPQLLRNEQQEDIFRATVGT